MGLPAAQRIQHRGRKRGGEDGHAAGVLADQVAGPRLWCGQRVGHSLGDDLRRATLLVLGGEGGDQPPEASWYRARPAGVARSISCRASRSSLPTASVRTLAGSTTTTRMSQGASSWRRASPIVARALLDAASGPTNGGV